MTTIHGMTPEEYKKRMADPTLTFYEKFYGESEDAVRNRLIHVLHEHKIHKIEATYNGGHDEGGVDDLQAWDKDGNELEVDTSNWEDPVMKACNDVLTTKFLSWALGCSVYGTLYVDMAQKRVWTEGSIEEWVDDKEPIDWTL